jgi:N-methylhydantoinase B/oxoprolinase/acetone carboxylase alpha subunit
MGEPHPELGEGIRTLKTGRYIIFYREVPEGIQVVRGFMVLVTFLPFLTRLSCSFFTEQHRALAPEGCLLNARRPAAVAAGNVETSTRVVDVVLGALAGATPDRMPAASHGSMNNVAMGAETWDYYETVGRGMEAHLHDIASVACAMRTIRAPHHTAPHCLLPG